MSKLSDVHAAYLTRIAAVMPMHTRLSNPYKPEENPDIILNKGFGIKIGEGANSLRFIGGMLSVRRAFGVVITRQYAAREDDAASKASTEKQILEDALLIQKDVEQDGTLGGVAARTSWVSDSGIEYIKSETDRFMKTEIRFETEYFETL